IASRLLRLAMDDGSHRTFLGYRVLHNRGLGLSAGADYDGPLYGGGVRWDPRVSADLLTMLATEMHWKTTLFGLPMCGGKGGIACNAKLLSDGEKQRLALAWIHAFAPFVVHHRDKPAPDMETTAELMDVMQAELGRMFGER